MEILVRAVSGEDFTGMIAVHAVTSVHHMCNTLMSPSQWCLMCCCLLQVCYYRDKQTTNKFQIAKVTKDGTNISEPFALETQWGYKAFEEPGAGAVGTW